eukprot:5916447-Pleurochrysis_carterae.AAC.1
MSDSDDDEAEVLRMLQRAKEARKARELEQTRQSGSFEGMSNPSNSIKPPVSASAADKRAQLLAKLAAAESSSEDEAGDAPLSTAPRTNTNKRMPSQEE